MEKINKTQDKITFKGKIDDSLINAIRRYVNRVPTLAIDEVEIHKNDSPLYDETVAHRIGLVPLKLKKSLLKKETELELYSKEEGFVKSGGIKGDLEVAQDNIPLTSLNKGGEIHIKCFVRAGNGEDHSKYTPGLIYFREIFDVKPDKEVPVEVIKKCPKGVFEEKSGKVAVKDALKCDFCEECVDYCNKMKKGSIKITPTEEVMVSIESFGQMDVKDIFKESIEVLRKDLLEVSKKLK